MKSGRILFAVAFMGLTLSAATVRAESVSEHAENLANVAMNETEGCLDGPMAQFGKYLGDWRIEDARRSQDGQSWTDGEGARWVFVCVGNGIAVQDYWLPKGGGTGTNLRIYDPATESWDIAWTSNTAPGLSHINAKAQADGTIVMRYVAPKQNPPRRVTFFPPTEEGWNWKLEMSFDGEKTWQEVYRIKATPQN